MNTVNTSGLTLKLRRVALDVKAIDLAARMGVSNSAISRLENSRVVSDEKAERYLKALATFGTVATETPQEPASAA